MPILIHVEVKAVGIMRVVFHPAPTHFNESRRCEFRQRLAMAATEVCPADQASVADDEQPAMLAALLDVVEYLNELLRVDGGELFGVFQRSPAAFVVRRRLYRSGFSYRWPDRTGVYSETIL